MLFVVVCCLSCVVRGLRFAICGCLLCVDVACCFVLFVVCCWAVLVFVGCCVLCVVCVRCIVFEVRLLCVLLFGV